MSIQNPPRYMYQAVRELTLCPLGTAPCSKNSRKALRISVRFPGVRPFARALKSSRSKASRAFVTDLIAGTSE